MRKSWIHRRLWQPILDLLRQGLTPERLSLCLTLGLIISIFPLFGTTTILCAVVALVLKLNLAAIQLANWVAAPLQILLILPFIRVGEKLTGHPPLPLSARQIAALFRESFRAAIRTLGGSVLDASLGWLVIAVPAGFLTYWILCPVLRRLSAKTAAAPISRYRDNA